MEEKLEYIIKEFNKLKNLNANYDCNEAVELVKKLQDYLNEKFPCDIDALFSFADMYRQADFKKNIDTISSEGNSEFIANAIENYCINN